VPNVESESPSDEYTGFEFASYRETKAPGLKMSASAVGPVAIHGATVLAQRERTEAERKVVMFGMVWRVGYGGKRNPGPPPITNSLRK
jgi:hypothetical protein